MRGNVAARSPRMRRIEELALGEGVDVSRERVKVAFVARLVGPAGEFDAGFVGGVAARHPLRLGDAEFIEEGLELRRRAFTNPDDSDRGRFDQRDAGALLAPVTVEQISGHPTCGPAAENDD